MTCTLRIINLNRDRGFTTMEFAKKKRKKRDKYINLYDYNNTQMGVFR